MAKHYKASKQFYSISTIYFDTFENKVTNTVYFEHKKDAIKRIESLFKKCYPLGVQSLIADNGDMLESPKYDDHDCHLLRFFTTASFCYELSTLTLEV